MCNKLSDSYGVHQYESDIKELPVIISKNPDEVLLYMISLNIYQLNAKKSCAEGFAPCT